MPVPPKMEKMQVLLHSVWQQPTLQLGTCMLPGQAVCGIIVWVVAEVCEAL